MAASTTGSVVSTAPTRAALKALGPGLRRRSDDSVGLAGNTTSDDESFDMDSDSHSAARGYPETDDDGDEPEEVAVKKNLCVVCKTDMGPENPRQLCRKTYCANAK